MAKRLAKATLKVVNALLLQQHQVSVDSSDRVNSMAVLAPSTLDRARALLQRAKATSKDVHASHQRRRQVSVDHWAHANLLAVLEES